MGKPNLPDIQTLLQAGINPKTGLPIRFGSQRCSTKEDIKKALRIIDEQDAVNRYTWYNLPCNITSQELERLLYYKGQLAFFYLKDLDEFYFMPYALDGTIDFYGRFNTIHPIPMTSGTEDKGNKAQSEILSGIKLKCVYGSKLELKESDLYDSAVLLHDYTKQLSQTILPRVTINDSILDIESECIPYMRTALLMGTGVKGVRVNDADQQASVNEGSASLTRAALNCEPYVPIVGNIEMQELTNGTVSKAEEYLLAMQSIDNFRLSTYGIDNGGLFEKKSYVNNQQTTLNNSGSKIGAVLQDGLSIRQNFCNIVNSIWNIGIWCEPSENIITTDIDGDGVDYERFDDNENVEVENNDSDVQYENI